MVDTAKTMGFPFMAGSSLPVTWRIAGVDMPLGAEIVEEVCRSAWAAIDSYDFHALETIQCLGGSAERGRNRRRSGSTALRGEAVWQARRRGSWASGGWDPSCSKPVSAAAISWLRRPRLQHVYPTPADMHRMVRDPVAYRFEYMDGLKATMLCSTGLVSDITLRRA